MVYRRSEHRREGPGLRRNQQDHPVFQEERYADGRDQSSDPGRMPHGPIGNPFNDDPCQSCTDHGNYQGRQKGQPGFGDGHKTDVGPQHVNIPVSEVDEFDDPIDHGISQGNQSIDTAQGYPIDNLLGKLMGKGSCIHKHPSL